MTRHMSTLVLATLLFAVVVAAVPCAAAKNCPVDLAPYAGKVVMVDFWATWCRPCLESFPWMSRMQRKLGERGFQIIAVNVDRDTTKTAEFLRKHPASGMKIILDPEGKIAEAFQLEGMPSTFLYDRNGTLASSHVGFETARLPAYEDAIAALLAKPTATGAEEKPDDH